MPTSFLVQFPAPLSLSHGMYAYNTGTKNLGFQISGVNRSVELVPGERIKYMIKPTGYVLNDSQIQSTLEGQTIDDDDNGLYFATLENISNDTKLFNYPKINLSNDWANTPFNLYWLQSLPDSSFSNYDKDLTDIYSFPPNLELNDITISGKVSNDNNKITYNISYPALNNDDSAVYTGGTLQPYTLDVQYYYANAYTSIIQASGFESGTKYYSSGSSETGISINLPFYDHRTENDVPAYYKFIINYNGINDNRPGSTPIEVLVNQRNFFPQLKASLSSNPKLENLKKINTINIPNNIISRKRLAIGIEDIKSIENVFKKDGVFVSNSYNLDFPIYTFSLKVNEYIPDYPNINKYDAVKYYVSFNSNEWIQISPITRNNEINVAKLIIFDELENNQNNNIIYINDIGIVNNFRIKIVFDLSNIVGNNFVSPEIRSYKCLVLDRDHFLNMEI